MSSAGLNVKIARVEKLAPIEIDRMFALMVTTYAGVDRAVFGRDLSEKSHVLLGRDEGNVIQGFSTIKVSHLRVDGRRVTGVFSGDTILAREYWTSPAFVLGFFSYLLRVRLRFPRNEVYWFLISKGIKTYAFMANNFPTHYPCYERETPPEFRRVLESYYEPSYGEAYNAETNVIRPPETYSLRTELSEVAAGHSKNPRVEHFFKLNPGWSQGEELACLARVDWDLPPFRLLLRRKQKAFSKKLSKKFGTWFSLPRLVKSA